MKSFKKLLTILTLTLLSSKTASAAPTTAPDAGTDIQADVLTVPSAQTDGGKLENKKRTLRRSISIDSFNSGLMDIGSGVAGAAPGIQRSISSGLLGIGKGVAGAASGTQQTADLLGDAIAALFHTVGGIAANAEQGAGVALANVAPAVQGTVRAIQDNHGALGDVAKILGGA